MIEVAAPVPLNGDELVKSLREALGRDDVHITYLPESGGLRVSRASEADRTTVAAVVAAHPAIATTAAAASQQTAANEATIRQQAGTALAANKTFLALASPSNAQIAAQVKALTRQNNALIRLVLRNFDAND